jgi:hypothetical protein
MNQSSAPYAMVSSVIEGFSEYREAARRGITAAGLRPLLVNEDFPSKADSSRNVCLDAVQASDILIVIIGQRGGWRNPSGKLVVEEEWEEAQRLRKRVLVFVQAVAHDDDASTLIRKLSDYVTGYFRLEFSTVDELESSVAQALATQSLQLSKPIMSLTSLSKALARPACTRSDPSIRVVIQPEQQFELVDPRELNSAEFLGSIYELGHSRSVGLFSYQAAKTAAVRGGSLEVIESDSRNAVHLVVNVHESGHIAIDSLVSPRRQNQTDSSIMSSMVIAEEEIERRIEEAFRFCRALYALKDPFGRNQSFRFNCALFERGYRTIERNPQPRTSFSMSSGSDGPVIAYAESRLVGLADFGHPRNESSRAVAMIVRTSKEGR